MQTALGQLLVELEAIGDKDEELFDSEVRESMGDAIFLALIKAEPGYSLPQRFGLFTPESEAKVHDALSRFLASAREECIRAGLTTFHQRLEAFQDPTVQTASGNDSEEFFGSTDPELFDDLGNLKES